MASIKTFCKIFVPLLTNIFENDVQKISTLVIYIYIDLDSRLVDGIVLTLLKKPGKSALFGDCCWVLTLIATFPNFQSRNHKKHEKGYYKYLHGQCMNGSIRIFLNARRILWITGSTLSIVVLKIIMIYWEHFWLLKDFLNSLYSEGWIHKVKDKKLWESLFCNILGTCW